MNEGSMAYGGSLTSKTRMADEKGFEETALNLTN